MLFVLGELKCVVTRQTHISIQLQRSNKTSDILVLKLISVLVFIYSLVRIFILFSFCFLDQ